ncbi:hypothetical protein EDD22DRAFT_955750 [Suillus occidentalis]|nr:hypothetical protein EDD22DRAFT_955750 [Suillus occidentalis]
MSTASGSSGQTRVGSVHDLKSHKFAKEMTSALVLDLPHSEGSPSPVHSASPVHPASPLSELPGTNHFVQIDITLTHCRNRPTALELRFTMKSIGRIRHSDIALTDVIEGRDIFLKGLSSLSDEILTLIATAKHASLQTIRQNILHLGWEIEEAECNRLVLKAFEQEEKKRLGMAESDYRFFKKLMVDRDLPALSQDVEYLRAAHDSEIESLASADEQMFQISTITPYATKYVAHRLPLHPNSSDTEYEPGEQDRDDDFSGDEAEVMQYPPERFNRRQNNLTWKGFQPGIYSEMNLCGRDAANQLGLPGDSATVPTLYGFPGPVPELDQRIPRQDQPQLYPPPQLDQPPDSTALRPLPQLDQSPPQLLPQLQGQQPDYPQPQCPQPQYSQPQYQYHQPHYPQPQYPQPQYPQPQYPQPPPQYPRPQYQHGSGLDNGMAQAQASAYAGAYALLQGEGALPPSQPNLVAGHMSQWGATRLVTLAPHHLGENTQGVIQTKSRISDTGRRRHQARLPPTPNLPSASLPSTSNVPASPILPIVSLTPLTTHKYRELAKEKFRGLLLNVAIDTDAAPSNTVRDTMINTALQATKRELFEQSIVKEPTGMHDYMVSSMADMRPAIFADRRRVAQRSYDY